MLSTRTAEEFLEILPRFRAPTLGPSGHGGLIAPEIKHFVSLGPTIAQFRRLLQVTGEVEQYFDHATSLIRSLGDLREMIAPLRIVGLHLRSIRLGFIHLIGAVMRQPGGARFLDEHTLDQLSAENGLDIRRHQLPSAVKSCAAALDPLSPDE